MLETVVDGYWLPARDGDYRARALFQRHYSAGAHQQRPGRIGNAARFVGNGEHMVLLTVDCRAVFAWRKQALRRDDQRGVECCLFRNESEVLSSDLIREAMDLAWERWPGERLFTFVDPRRIRSTNPGYCYLRAGWRRLDKRTGRGLVVLEVYP